MKDKFSINQVEYSRNLFFQQRAQMEALLNGAIERTRPWPDAKRVKTIFGANRRPFCRRSKKQPRFEVMAESPEYDLTIFKVHFGKLTVKLYTKGERVLRSEAVVHNTKALSSKQSLPHFPETVTELKKILVRLLDALHCVDIAFLPDGILEQLEEPGFIANSKIPGIRLSKPRLRAVMVAVIRLAATPGGIRVSMVAKKVRALLGWDEQADHAWRASYDLRKLQAKSWIRKIGKSHKYEALPEGLKVMTALLVLREKVIKPVVSGAGKLNPGPKPKHLSQLEQQYRILQADMLAQFNIVGISA